MDDNGSDVSDFVEDARAETGKKKPAPGEWTKAVLADAEAKGMGNLLKFKPTAYNRRVIEAGGVPYCEPVIEEIFDRMLAGEPIARICADSHMPNVRSIFNWRKEHPDFAEKMDLAKKEGSHFIADDCLRIADDPTIDPMHKRIMVDTRLRLIKSWHRKAYGENVQLSGDENGAPVRFFIDGLSDRDRDK